MQRSEGKTTSAPLRPALIGAQGVGAVEDATENKDSPSRRSPAAADLLATPDALLNRSHLRELGLERRAVDAVFRAVPVVVLPGYNRPVIRVRDYLALLEESTFDGRTRVR
jgi:hypothetical protein